MPFRSEKRVKPLYWCASCSRCHTALRTLSTVGSVRFRPTLGPWSFFALHDRTHGEALFHRPGPKNWAILPVEDFSLGGTFHSIYLLLCLGVLPSRL